MERVKIVTRYEYDEYHRPGVFFDSKDPDSRSRALQSGKDEADINKIMDRYEKTGVLGTPLDDVSERIPKFGDFTNIGDYHAVLSRITDLQRNFMMLPAKVRAKFDNDPAKCIEFINDEKNYKECVELGIIPVDEVKEAALVAASQVTVAPVVPPEGGTK
ncbi:MAG: internal scaffolding protein [Arizlama microvirus]|nr:MAG: internal scaffolding protein [Arizlama microvirus]